LGLLLTNVVGSFVFSVRYKFSATFSYIGASALLSLIERSESQNHIERAEATTANQIAAQSAIPTTRTLRSLEMRLAMNNDILGDEDLMSYAPGPDLTSILGRDLSTYHRVSGRDIIMNQIINRQDINSCSYPQSKFSSLNGSKSDPLSSFCQQNNSKMDTPILNRKLQRTWSSSGFARKGKLFKFISCHANYINLTFQKKKLFRIWRTFQD
jgi:hypothetical protein